MIRNVSPTNSTVENTENKSAENIVKVTIHIPNDVSETIRQQKINHLYDILNPKIVMESKKKVA